MFTCRAANALVLGLGNGGMGWVYLAEDPRLETFVAIKLLKEAGEDWVLRFQREAKSLAKLRGNTNIASVFDVGDDHGRPFILMEYVDGETLAEMIRRRAPISLSRKLEMIEDLCSGLAFAHQKDIVHRDVKPGNVMIDSVGTLKILDFGIARVGASSITQSGMLIGTLNYMSPEQIAGEVVDRRSDVFAVGAVFYELLTYTRAFPGGIPEVLPRILHAAPEPIETFVPDIDVEVARIVDRALEKSVEHRYQDLGTMRRDVLRVRRRIESLTTGTPTIVISNDQTHLIRRTTDTEPELLALIANARAAFDAKELGAAQILVATVLARDPTNKIAAALLHTIETEAIERDIYARVAEADQALNEGDLTRAAALVAELEIDAERRPDVQQQRAEIVTRLQELVRERQRIATSETLPETMVLREPAHSRQGVVTGSQPNWPLSVALTIVAAALAIGGTVYKVGLKWTRINNTVSRTGQATADRAVSTSLRQPDSEFTVATPST